MQRSSGNRVARRPHVLVFNQYYWPGFEATAHLLAELCGALADDFDVTVVTGTLRDPPAGAGVPFRSGVEIRRVWSTCYDRRRLARRAANYVSYLGSSLLAGIT